MQHMRATGDAQYAPFASLCHSLVGWPDGLDCCTDRHACSKRDDASVAAGGQWTHSFFFAYAEEYLVDVKFVRDRPDWGRSYSITSSARASSVGGIARSSAFAVFRLITSSYLVGACTGKSAAFSPLRMRST